MPSSCSRPINMPVRKIPIQHRSIRGKYALKRLGYSVWFESRLERDFLVLTDFDWNVASIEEQPISIPWFDDDGRAHTYTPDFLVRFVPVQKQIASHPHGKSGCWLVEVKDEKTLREDWRTLRPRFRAATRYIHERGGTFHLFTERLIRTPRLQNADLLLPLLDSQNDEEHCATVLSALSSLGETTPAELARFITPSADQHGSLLQFIWRLVAQAGIGADLENPVAAGRTRIWPVINRSSRGNIIPSF